MHNYYASMIDSRSKSVKEIIYIYIYSFNFVRKECNNEMSVLSTGGVCKVQFDCTLY